MGRKVNLEQLRTFGDVNEEDIPPPEMLATYTVQISRGCYYLTVYITAFRNGSWLVSVPEIRRSGMGESLAIALDLITNSYT